MIDVSKDDVLVYAPEFSDLPEEVVDSIIELARSFVSETKWDTKAKQGICLMTAHLLKELGFTYDEEEDETTNTGTDVTGPVASEKVGDLARSYGTFDFSKGSEGDQLLATTKYGKTFLMLRKTLLFTPMVT